MDIETLHRLRKAFAQIESHQHVAALIFYKRLFELDPSLRPLFKNDIEEQSKKLMDMLAAALSMAEAPDQLTSVLEQMGARHATYGVETSHYATVGQALLDMLAETLGDEFTPLARQEWTALYVFISNAMLAGVEKAAAEAAKL